MTTKAIVKARRIALRDEVDRLIGGRVEIGLNALRRGLYHTMPHEPAGQNGRLLVTLLKECGWVRDGWIGTGYDREPRYVPLAACRNNRRAGE